MKKIVLLFAMFTLVITVLGQDDISVYGDRRKEFDERNKTLDSWIRASEKQQERYKSGLPTSKNKLSKTDIIKLTPPKEDFEKYAQFLKKKKNGILKLLNLYCDRRIVDANDTKCFEAPQIVGNGSLYSFSERSYLKLNLIDIRLTEGKFSGWYPLNYALFSELGDVSIETLDLTKDIQSLKKFATNKDLLQFDTRKKLFEAGVEIEGRFYQSEIPVKTDSTYLLLSGKYRFPQKTFDETIVVFRVIRKDTNGSVVLIWEEL